MDENIWHLTHILLWLVGIQTCILGGVLFFMWWTNLSKRTDDLSKRINEQSQRIDQQSMVMNELKNEIALRDKKIYRIELLLRLQEGDSLKEDKGLIEENILKNEE